MTETSTAPKRRGRLVRFGAALIVLFSLAGYFAARHMPGGGAGPSGPGCEVVASGGRGEPARYEFTPEQAVNAATITAVGTARELPERAVTIALATALQESALRNIRYGDRDSLGLFQQRPSQGWGRPAEIMDPAYAAGQFYDHLVKVQDYADLPLTVAAQEVQRSAYPDAYAKHEPDAELLAAALTGRSAATLTCSGPSASDAPARPDAVRAALARDFDTEVLGKAAAEVPAGRGAGARQADARQADARGTGGAPGRVSTAGSRESAASASPSPAAARTVTVPVAEPGARQRGWQFAHWAVANASDLGIERVTYGGRSWTADRGDWRKAGDDGSRGTHGSPGSDARVSIVTSR
ncbi:heavy metal transporter [Streptomyces sp. NPDC056600]|uniref:heavy metal transporter n=1 Tax=Streptomyces sp. NPDC056600 TaxID=3345874 RepID=UPI0036C582E4